MDHKRILIVDDKAGVTRSLKLNLEATVGYKVRTENDSVLALAAARDFHPELILLDVLMPTSTVAMFPPESTPIPN